MSLEDCLPAELRTPETTITRIRAGMSGAGVYRVEHAGRVYVLKVAGESEPLERFRGKLEVLERAVRAGVAPRVVHSDEGRRAIVSEYVHDRMFGTMLAGEGTREAAIVLLGQTLRRVHEMPLPHGAEPTGALGFLNGLWSGVSVGGFALPGFVRDGVEGVLGETAPGLERALVMSHNDVNPTNLVYDGERLLLLDWETAAPNDPYYDLATVSLFYRLAEPTCRRLLAAYDGAPAEVAVATPSPLPPGFRYNQRLAAALCGTMFLNLARRAGHPGATGQETLETTQPLFEVYQRARAGALGLGSAEGQWAFGLALIQAGAQLQAGASL
jgi:aminoglycoside phosphotransferase (APT) family kinase protein